MIPILYDNIDNSVNSVEKLHVHFYFDDWI